MLLQKEDRKFSLRQVATRIGIQPSYLSKLERGEQSYLSEEKIIALADELNEDKDVLLALIGKISENNQKTTTVICPTNKRIEKHAGSCRIKNSP